MKSVDILEVYDSMRCMLSSVSDELGQVTNSLKRLASFRETLSCIVGHPITVEEFDGFPSELIPDIGLDDKKYLDKLSASLERRTGVDRMAALSTIVSKYMPAIRDAQVKYSKLCDRIKRDKCGSSEFNNAVFLKQRMEKTIKTMAYRVKFCMAKFLETRKALLNRVLGLTTVTFGKLGGVTIGDSILANDIGEITSEIAKADTKRMGVEND